MKAIKPELFYPDKRLLSILKPVTVTSIFNADNELNENGLYSKVIFGDIGTDERKTNLSYIDLHSEVMEPAIFEAFDTLSNLYGKVMRSEVYVELKDGELIPTTPDKGETGISFIYKNIDKIKFKRTESESRDDKIKLIKDNPKFISEYIVVPAYLRDIDLSGDKPSEYEVNDIYKKLINLSSLLKNLSPEIINSGKMDHIRYKLQMAVQEVYDYFLSLVDGKHKHLRKNWTKRSVTYGTRNIIIGGPSQIEDLGDKNNPDMDTVTAGVFQISKGIEPYTVKNLRDMIEDAFPLNTELKSLYNIEKKKFELVKVPKKVNNKWTNSDGIEGMFGVLLETDIAISGIEVMKRYGLKAIFDDGISITVISDNRGLEDIDPKYIRNMTWLEFFYLAILDDIKDKHGTVTRYPVTGIGSVVPCKIRVRPSTETRMVTFNRPDGTETQEVWPVLGSLPFLALSIPFSRLAGLGADFDGDMVSLNIVMSSTANQEIKDLLNSVAYCIDPDGKLLGDLEDDISSNVITTLNL